MNPYATLGLNPDATEEDVREAYRRKAKDTHPDAPGGNADEFRKVASAHLVLKDPVRRKRYDETGEADDRADNPDVGALNIIAGMIETIIREGSDAMTVDLIDAMRQQLDDIIKKLGAAITKGNAARKRAAKMQKRFKRKSQGTNMLDRMIQHQIDGIDRSIAQVTADKAKHERAREIILDYSFDVEKLPIPTVTITGTSSVSGLAEAFQTFNRAGRWP